MLRLGRFGGYQEGLGRNDLGPINRHRQLPKLSPSTKGTGWRHTSPQAFILRKEHKAVGQSTWPWTPSTQATRSPPQQPGTYAMATRNTPHHTVHREHIIDNMVVTAMAVTRGSV